MKKRNYYPFNYDGLLIEEKNKVVIRTDIGHLCGYVEIHNSKIPKKWHGNYNADALQYLNIHGGITFAEIEGNYTIFGFDCAHAGDEEKEELKDFDYVMKLTVQMENQIIEYAKNYKKWKELGKRGRVNLLDKIIKKGDIKNELGFGAMIGLLGGATEFEK